MNIVVDYKGIVPDAEMESKMIHMKAEVITKLKPMEDEFDKSEGILLLYTNGQYLCAETPTNVAYKIGQLLDFNPFADF